LIVLVFGQVFIYLAELTLLTGTRRVGPVAGVFLTVVLVAAAVDVAISGLVGDVGAVGLCVHELVVVVLADFVTFGSLDVECGSLLDCPDDVVDHVGVHIVVDVDVLDVVLFVLEELEDARKSPCEDAIVSTMTAEFAREVALRNA